MPTRALLVLTLALTALTWVSPSPAGADSGSYRDPTGDAPTRWDITRMRYDYREFSTSMTMRVRNLRGGFTQLVVLSVDPVHSDTSFGVYFVRHADGTLSNRLLRYDADGISRVPCGLRARWYLGKDLVKASFNPRCMHYSRAARFSALTGAGNGRRGDPADWTNRAVRLGYTEGRVGSSE